jgi:RNA polymerase sigma-70 factor, ECF subfamily
MYIRGGFPRVKAANGRGPPQKRVLVMRPELIQASELLRQQTPESVEKAIGLLQNTVFSFSMKMCGHREDAEDTMQDVLFASLKYLADLKEPSELAAWLYTVTRNRCRRMRRMHPGSEKQHISLDELMPDENELRLLMQAAGEGPEHEFLRNERQDLLHNAVLRVPTGLRLVLVLHDMEDLSSEEVARILGVQTGTVRVRLHRARLAVRKEMTRILKGLPEQPPIKGKSVARRPKECRELFANLSEYIDARMEPRTCEQMRVHIEGCPACVAFLKDLRAAIDRCRTLEAACDINVAARMRALMTQEYLRMMQATNAPHPQ